MTLALSGPAQLYMITTTQLLMVYDNESIMCPGGYQESIANPDKHKASM